MNSSQSITAWSSDTESDAGRCFERYCEFACKSAMHGESPLKPTSFSSTGELAPSCAQLVLNMLAQGQDWQTSVVVDSEYAGDIVHKTEQLWQKSGRSDDLHQSNIQKQYQIEAQKLPIRIMERKTGEGK